jgi:hypothetical protein
MRPNGTPKSNPRFFLALCTAALVFAVVDAVYLANGRTIGAGDTRPARYLPFAILRDGTFYLDGLVDSRAQGPPRYYADEIDGHYVSDYPVGAAITGAVFYAPSVLQGRRPRASLCAKLEKYAASAIVALSAAVLFAALRLLSGPGAALFLTAVYAFATSNLSTASQALWQHGASELMIASALYAILRARDDDRWAPLAGFPLAFSLICRPTNALIALPLAAYALGCHPRRGRWLIVAALPPLAFQLWYNLQYFGDPLHTQFPIHGGATWSTPLGEGLAGLLASPARGLLVYSPVFAFSLFGLAGAWRRTGDGLLRSLGIVVAPGKLEHFV